MSSLSVVTGRLELTLCFQILQLSSHRLFGCRPQARIDVRVYPRHDLPWRTVSCRESCAYLIESLLPMVTVEGQPAGRISDDRPMAGKQFDHVTGSDQSFQKLK